MKSQFLFFEIRIKKWVILVQIIDFETTKTFHISDI